MIKIKSENSDKQIKASKSCESGGGIKMLILMTCIVIVGILGGGYYVSVSAVTGIVLTGVLFYRMYVKKRITAAWDLNMAAFAVLVFGYLLSCLWAVDSGMALMGVVKFLPLLLFYVLVSGLTDEREKMIASLPMLGCLMTAFSFVMMQFEVFEQWVSVAGRLSGFFQYPNTYALFMLICLILVMWRFDYKKIDWLDIVYGGCRCIWNYYERKPYGIRINCCCRYMGVCGKVLGEKSYYFSVGGRRRCGGDIGCCSRKRRYS